MSLPDPAKMRIPWDQVGDWTGRTALVTGGAGYLGRHLTAALRHQGAHVRSLDLVPAPGATESAIGDLRDQATVRAAADGCEVVFHTAAALSLLGIAPRAVRDHLRGVNVTGTHHALAAARAAGARAFVYTSSANVIIDRPIHDEDESAPYASQFVDLYGATKVEAERAVLAADQPGGLRTAAVRPGGIWGPGDGGFMVRTFLRQLAAGRFVTTLGDPSAVVDNTHVDTLVLGELLAARRLLEAPDGVAGEPFFLTDDERLNGILWFRPITDGLGLPWPRWNLPGGLMYGVAWLGEVATLLGAPEPPVTRIGVLKLARTSSVRVDKARRVLGWAPQWTSPDGLRFHLDDYRACLAAWRAP